MTGAAYSGAVIATWKPARGLEGLRSCASRVSQGAHSPPQVLLHHLPSRSAVGKAIAVIPDNALTPTKYANAIFDDQQRWTSDAQVT